MNVLSSKPKSLSATEVWASQVTEGCAQVEQCPCLWPHFARYMLDFRTAQSCCNNSGTSMLVNSCSDVSCKDSFELDKSEELRAVNLQEAA